MKTTPLKCYGLVLYTYDHYVWENVMAVSHDTVKLEDEYNVIRMSENNKHGHRELLLDTEDAEKADEADEAHFVIEEIKYL